MVRILLCIAIVAGCHHDEPPPVAPAPSSTGTPVGYLLDAATDLHLTSDQLSDLRGIDENLKMRLAEIDHDAKPKKTAGTGSGSAAPKMRMTGGGGGGHHRGRGGTAGSATPTQRAPGTSAVDQLRADVVRAAIVASLARLGPEQVTRAKKVLDDHDVDVDLGSTDEQQIEPPEP